MSLLSRIFPPMSPERFARRFLARLRRAGETRDVTIDSSDFCLIFAGEDNSRIFLGNAYRDYAAAPWLKRGEVIRRYLAFNRSLAAQAGDESTSFADVAGQLLPRVRERFYHESLRLMQLKAGGPPIVDAIPTEPLADGLTVEIVRDLPDAIMSVSSKTLADWGVSFEEAMKVARENLWRQSNEEFVQASEGFLVSPWRDTHDASRMLLHDLIWQLPVRGAHVVMVPNRNLLLVAGDEDDEALSAMAAVAEATLQENRPMTGTAYRLEGTRWAPFLPPRSSPAHVPLATAAMCSLATDYVDQKQALEELYAKTGRDVFVASLMTMRRADGSLWTLAVWIDGITDALIPRCDYVHFGAVAADGNKMLGAATWADVERVVGDLLNATEDYPPRYNVTRFPTPDQLARMNLTTIEAIAAATSA